MNCSPVGSFERAALTSPRAPALAWRGLEWSYGDLLAATAGVRDAIAARGLPRGARVALLLKNSPQYVALYYGVMAGGWVAVPLNAQERAGVLGRQVEHSEASLVIGDAAHPEWGALEASLPAGVGALAVSVTNEPRAHETLIAELGGERGSATGTRLLKSDTEPDDLAAIIYTSGTTGSPKGVMLSHRNLAANAEAIVAYLRLTRQDRGLCVLPFHFSYGNSVLTSHLTVGAALVLEDSFAFPHVTLQRIQEERITGFAGVPSTFALLLGRCNLADFDLRHLRYLTQAGGAMPGALIGRLGEALPWVDFYVMYGQTEATARLTYLPPARLGAKSGSVGIPIPGVRIEIRNTGRSLAPGETGEVWASGPNVMLGYWRNEAATGQVLRDGWLNTGDLGYLDDEGFLYLSGRAAEMIKVGAFRISPLEVEEVVAALPEVEEVAATGVTDEMLGQSVKVVIVLKPDADLDVRRVKAHCRAHLATYKIPKVVEFVTQLPRTSSGKVRRHQLT